MIPGNKCTGGIRKDAKVERKCADALTTAPNPASGEVEQKKVPFDGDWDKFEFDYLERGDSSSTESETVIVRPLGDRPGPISITQDHGKTWTQPPQLKGESIWAIIPHYHFKEVVFFVTTGRKVIYTIDRGVHFKDFSAPYKADMEERTFPLAFHPDKKDWLIWMGEKCDAEGDKTDQKRNRKGAVARDQPQDAAVLFGFGLRAAGHWAVLTGAEVS